MEFGPSEEQTLLQNMINRFLDDNSKLDDVRVIAETTTGYDEKIWNGLSELGIIGLIVPVEYGGSGLTMFDAALVIEALGRNVTPAPFLGSAIMGPVAVLAAGTTTQKQSLLPAMAAGEVKTGIAMTEVVGSREGAGVTLKGGKLSGKAMFVIDAHAADQFLVAVGTDTLALVTRDATGLTVNGLKIIDRTRNVAELLFENVECTILGKEGAAGEAIARTIDAGRIALAADTLGAAQMMIEKAVSYAKERYQFERPIGSFQAVKHLCAEMTAEIEPSISLVWYTAHAFDAVPEEARMMAAQAKAHLSEAGKFIARTATEVHGGMGFTDLMGVHYWFKRIGFNRQLLGGPEKLRHEAAVAEGWAA